MRSLIARVDLGAVPASTHRAVVRVGAVGAWLCTALFLIAWLVTGNSSLIVEGIGPLATSVVFTGQILLKREDAVLTLLSGAAVVVVAFTFIGTPDASIAERQPFYPGLQMIVP